MENTSNLKNSGPERFRVECLNIVVAVLTMNYETNPEKNDRKHVNVKIMGTLKLVKI